MLKVLKQDSSSARLLPKIKIGLMFGQSDFFVYLCGPNAIIINMMKNMITKTVARRAAMQLLVVVMTLTAQMAWADGQNTVYYIDKNYQRVYPDVESFTQLGENNGPGWYFPDDSYYSNGVSLISDENGVPSVIVKDGFGPQFAHLACTAGSAGPPIFYGQSRWSIVELLKLSGPVVFAGPDFKIDEAFGNATVSIAEGFYYSDGSDKVYSGPCSITSYGGITFSRVFPYIDADGNTQYTNATILSCAEDITANFDGEGNLRPGTYIITGNFTYDSEIKIPDRGTDTYFILADGAKLTVPKISSDYTLTIYSQSEGTGELVTVIDSKNLDLYIHGGKFTGYSQSGRIINCNNLTINGGIVSCTSLDGSGIVGYYSVTINGGEVTSTSTNGHAIYSPSGNVVLAGGNVTATATGTGAYGISAGDHILLSGSKVKASSYDGSVLIDGRIHYSDGSNFYTGDTDASAIAGQTLTPKFPYIDNTGELQYAPATILRSASDIAHAKVEGKLPGGWYFIYGSDFTYDQEITLSGDANIILADGTRLTATAGINAAGHTLNIYGQENDSGTLDASITAKYLNLYGGTLKSGTVTASNLSLRCGILIPSEALGNVSFSTPYLVSGSDTPINSLGSPETYVGKKLSPKCYSYIDVGGIEKQKKVAHVKEVTYADYAEDIPLSDGWYIFKPGDAYVYGIIIPEGDVHLILPESTFHLRGDINLHGKLTIYGQTQNTSYLDVANVYSHLSHTEDIGFNIVSGTVLANHFTDYSESDDSYLNFTVVLSGGILQALSYDCGLSTADGLYYKDESDNFYYGTLSDAEKTAAAEKTLSPSPKTYSVIFDPNGGEGEMARMFLDYGGEWKELPGCTFTRTDYAFSTWNTKADGTGEDYNVDRWVKNLADPGESITLYAQWGLDIANCTATVPNQTMDSYSYIFYKFEDANSGNAATGTVVKDGDNVLTVGKDYRFKNVIYKETRTDSETMPHEVGDKCILIIEGMGDYAGTLNAEFTIVSPVASDTWGNLTWAIDANGNFTITGTGAMKEATQEAYPWYDKASHIQSITIGEGITTVASEAFAGTSQVNSYGNVKTVSLPSTLTTIADNAFAFCTGATITIPESVTTLGANPFNQVSSLEISKPLEDGDGISDLISKIRFAKSTTFTYKRSFTANVASTVCLPFDYTPQSEGTYYSFTAIDKETIPWTVTMTATAASLTANTPYLFVPAAAGEVTFSDTSSDFYPLSVAKDDPKVEGGKWNLIGTYKTRVWDDSNNTDEIGSVYGFAAEPYTGDGYSVAAGDFVKAAAGASIAPFRAYLKYTAPGSSSARNRGAAGEEALPSRLSVRLVNADGSVTAIGTMDTKTGEVRFDSDAWYSIDGRRLNGKPAQKGVYINNGKKVIVK